MASRTQILSLYHQLLRESSKFHNYNFREYALRKVRNTFRLNRDVTDQAKLGQLADDAERNLALIKRQVAIGNAFSHESVMNQTFRVKRQPSPTPSNTQ